MISEASHPNSDALQSELPDTDAIVETPRKMAAESAPPKSGRAALKERISTTIQRNAELQDTYRYSHSSGRLLLCDVEDFRHHPDTVAGTRPIHASLA